MRYLIAAVFFCVILAVDVGAHWYFYNRLIRDPQWPPVVQRIGGTVIIGFGVLLPLGLMAFRVLPRAVAQPLAWAAYIWMGVALYLILALFLGDLVRWVLGRFDLMATQTTLASGRREVMAKGVASVAALSSTAVSSVALRSGLAEVEVKDVEIAMPRLPPALEGLHLTQLSDIHVGPTIGKDFISTLVERSNAQRPDAVVITGDLVDGSVKQLFEHVAPLAKLKARYGVYFVTGNHEYYSGVQEWEAAIAKLGIKVLRNERVRLGDQAASIDLAGIDDHTAHRFGNGHGADIERAIRGRDPDRELVLLAHQPRSIEDAVKGGASLMLSGHTHGGQLWPFNHVVSLVAPYVAGLYRHDPKTQVYVSRGTGYWGPPMRLLAPSEITNLRLVRG